MWWPLHSANGEIRYARFPVFESLGMQDFGSGGFLRFSDKFRGWNRLFSKKIISKKQWCAAIHFFHIHEMEAENWSPFTVIIHRCRIGTGKKRQLCPHPPVYTPPTKILCTQLCSTNEAISTLTLIPNRNGTWINMLRAIDVAGRWKIPKNSSLQNWIYPWWRWLKELNRGPWQMASPETANNLKFPPGGLNSLLPPFRCYFDTEAIRPSSWDQLGCNIFNCKFGLASHMSDGSAGDKIILTVLFKLLESEYKTT